jgi:hypothetical protein
MYATLMQVLRTFFGTGLLQVTLFAAVSLVVIALAAMSRATVRAGYARLSDSAGWRGALAALGGALFKVLVLAILARIFVTAITLQAGLFGHAHGRVTERNRSAVIMKWGLPHEQNELQIQHTRKRTWVTRQLRVAEDKRGEDAIVSESFWKDEPRPVQAVNGKLPTIVSVQEEERDVEVPQKSIVAADVDIRLRANPRRLGNANYAGYDDLWRFRYTVANRWDGETTAHMTFPLPADRGIFDEMRLLVDGSNVLDLADSGEAGLRWNVAMAPRSQTVVEIAYRSRGLEHLRYIPKRMSQTGHYRVSLTVEGIPPDKLDYPIGSMPPVENLATLRGSPYTLTWNFDNALTSYDVGIKLPLAEQPAYHFANVLNEAPVGFAILLALLVLPRLVAGVTVRLGVAVIVTIAYYLLLTLMGHVADLLDGFTRPFLAALAPMLAFLAWFRLKDTDPRYFRVQDTLAYAAVAVLFPLAVIDTDRTGLWMQLTYLAVLLYVCAVWIVFRARARESQTAR